MSEETDVSEFDDQEYHLTSEEVTKRGDSARPVMTYDEGAEAFRYWIQFLDSNRDGSVVLGTVEVPADVYRDLVATMKLERLTGLLRTVEIVDPLMLGNLVEHLLQKD